MAAQTEAPYEIMLTLEHGKEYYIRCSIVAGYAVGHPKLELVKNAIGRAEIQSFEPKDDSKEVEHSTSKETSDDIYYHKNK